MTFRLMGLPEETRLAIEQASGNDTEQAKLIYEAAVKNAVETVNQSLNEVQAIIGPHGSISRLQSGGVRITPGTGIGVFVDGVYKTQIQPNGSFVIGSDITNPITTTEIFFVEETVYNGETFGAGDFLIGDNSDSNLKFDASEGQLQFRLGSTVNVYMDTDGKLKAGTGNVILSYDGVSIVAPENAPSDQRSYKFVDADGGNVLSGMNSYFTGSNRYLWLFANGGSGASDEVRLRIYAKSGNETNIPTIQLFAKQNGQAYINMNETGNDVDFSVYGGNPGTTPVIKVDANQENVGIGTNTPNSSYKLDVNGKVNIPTGFTYDINGSPHTHAGAAAETNANDLFSVTSPGGTSAFIGTIATLPGGAVLTYNVSSGTEGAMVPTSTSQLAKMRLYNTTRGTHALISNCNVGTNTLTLTANVPVGWTVGDTITIASQTVSGGSLDWVDLEITSGPTGKSALFIVQQVNSATVGHQMRLHPFTASFSTSKYATPCNVLVSSQTTSVFGIIPIASNIFSLAWNGTPTAVVVREAGYLS